MIEFNAALVEDMIRGEVLLILPAGIVERCWGVTGLADESEHWVTGQTRCRMCGHEALCSWPPEIIDDTIMECDWCHNRTSEPIAEVVILVEELP